MILAAPVMPSKTEDLLEVLNSKDSSVNWGELKPGTQLKDHEALFPRLELKESA